MLVANAALTCRRDGCYSVVAFESKTNPTAAVRRADCSSVLKTYIEDTKTVTRTTSKTVSTRYVIATANPVPVLARQLSIEPELSPRFPTTPNSDTPSTLAPRDQVVIGGKKPSYATQCKDLQDYAQACLCYGVKASTYRAPTKTAAAIVTISATATTTISLDEIAYLREEGSDFCTTFNDYDAPHVTATAMQTIEQTSTLNTVITFTVTAGISTIETTLVETAIPLIRRGANFTAAQAIIPVETYLVIYPAKNTESTTATITKHIVDGSLAEPTGQNLEKRILMIPNPTPASIRDWVPAKISAACSVVATGTITDSEITKTATIAVSTFTETATVDLVVPEATLTVTNTFTTPFTAFATPTLLAGNLNGAHSNIDDVTYRLELPFEIGLFGRYLDVIFVSTNGIVSIGAGDASYVNTNLPKAYFPPSVFAFWDDLMIYKAASQGIYYSISGEAPNRIISFEYTIAQAYSSAAVNHFSITLAEGQRGVVLVKYFDMQSSGSATIGVAAADDVIMYSYNEYRDLSNTFVRFDTEAGTFTEGPL